MSMVCVALHIGLAEVLLAQRDVVALLVLIALHDVRPLHHLAGALVHALVTHGGEVAAIEKVQVECARLRCRMKLYGDVDETEGDGAGPDCAGHGFTSGKNAGSDLTQYADTSKGTREGVL
jgi:hypothetical protein